MSVIKKEEKVQKKVRWEIHGAAARAATQQQVKHLNLCKRDVDGWRYRTGESTGRYREISGGPRRRTYTNRSSCFKCWGVRWLKIWVGVEVGERWKDDMVLHILIYICHVKVTT